MSLAVVTGGAGFIGTHLCAALLQKGYSVVSLDNYFTGRTKNHIVGVEYRAGHTKDIRTIIPETPDVVYHLGEYSRVAQSLAEPDVVFDLNISGTLGVLAHWREHTYKLIYAGSSTLFGDIGVHHSPYTYSKATNVRLVSNYASWYNLPYAISYFYNVYGEGERAGTYGTVIEIFRQQRAQGQPLTIHAPGTQRRNFTHVSDVVDGLIRVGEQGNGDGYCIGSKESYSILEVASFFKSPVILQPGSASNRMESGIDTSKMEGLGWNATRSLRNYIESL